MATTVASLGEGGDIRATSRDYDDPRVVHRLARLLADYQTDNSCHLIIAIIFFLCIMHRNLLVHDSTT